MSERDNRTYTQQKPLMRRRGSMGFGGPMHGMGGEKARDFKGTMKKLAEYLKPYGATILAVLILAFGSAVFAIGGPKILGNAITELFNGFMGKVRGASVIDFESLAGSLLLLVGLYLTSSIFGYIQGFMMAGVVQKVSYRMRKAIAEKINRLPLKYFDKTTHGEVLSRITNDVDTVSMTLNQVLSPTLIQVTTMIGVFVMMLSISWAMTLAALLIIPFSMFFVMFIVKRSQKYFRQQQDYLGHVNGHVEEIFGGHTIMKAFNGEKRAIDTFNRLNDTLYSSAWKSQFLSGMMMPIMGFIGNLGYVVVSILGGWLAIRKAIQVGDILSFIQYVRQFTQPVGQLANIANVLQSTAAAAERVFEFLGEEEEQADTDKPVKVGRVEGHGEITNRYLF